MKNLSMLSCIGAMLATCGPMGPYTVVGDRGPQGPDRPTPGRYKLSKAPMNKTKRRAKAKAARVARRQNRK